MLRYSRVCACTHICSPTNLAIIIVLPFLSSYNQVPRNSWFKIWGFLWIHPLDLCKDWLIKFSICKNVKCILRKVISGYFNQWVSSKRSYSAMGEFSGMEMSNGECLLHFKIKLFSHFLKCNAFWWKTHKTFRLPNFEMDFLNYCLYGFLMLDNYGKFDLTDDTLYKCIPLSSAGIKSTLETSATLLNLRKEFQVSFQLFVVLWVSDDADVNKTPKWLKLKATNLADFKLRKRKKRWNIAIDNTLDGSWKYHAINHISQTRIIW